MGDHTYSVVSGGTGANEESPEHLRCVDEVISAFMSEQGIPGATLAIWRDGTPVYSQGYGVAGPGHRVRADSLFRVASISKPVTAAAVLVLVEEGRLQLKDKVFGPEGLLPRLRVPRKGDKRLLRVEVEHLLQHSAGWDRDIAGDAVFYRLSALEKLDPLSSAYNTALVQHILSKKLQFTPGTRHAYSNFGYLVLGMVVEAVTGEDYEQFVCSLLAKVGITDMYVGATKRSLHDTEEVHYFNNREPAVVQSILPGEETVLPQYGSFPMENTGSYGGWVASTAHLLAFLHALPGHLLQPYTFQLMLSRPGYCTEQSWYALGLDVQDGGGSWGHTGGMEGTSTTLMQHSSGLAWAFLCNAWAKDLDLDGLVKFALSRVPGWPLHHQPQVLGDSSELEVLSSDRCQVVRILLPHHQVLEFVGKWQKMGFCVQRVNACVLLGGELVFNVVLLKCEQPHPFAFDVKDEEKEAVLTEKDLMGFQPSFVESYYYKEKLCHILIFEAKVESVTVVLAGPFLGKVFLKRKREMSHRRFHLLCQSVVPSCSCPDEIEVTGLFEKSQRCKSEAWLQIPPEEFVVALGRNITSKRGLIYVKFYSMRNSDVYVSAAWSSLWKKNCLQRFDVSRYGFLYELRAASANNVRVHTVCSYVSDGVLYFGAIWVPSS